MHRSSRPASAKLLERYRREQRGTGVFTHYAAWNQVRRADPPSLGRSHLHVWQNRQVALMTDLQLAGFLFATQLQGLVDVREQFPLALEETRHELAPYDAKYAARLCPGTMDLARTAGVRHPTVRAVPVAVPFVMTTHQVITIRDSRGSRLIAVSYRQCFHGRRQRDLDLEARYWTARDTDWLLITSTEIPPDVSQTLRRVAGWALSPDVGCPLIAVARDIAFSAHGRPLTWLLGRLSEKIGDLDLANRALWQAVWQGQVPLDWRRGWRPQSPVNLLDPTVWADLNPLYARRSAWNWPSTK